jgi:limonene-1,2-epoxide hydrolase
MGQNQRVVEDFIAAWGRNDVDEIMSFFAPDAIYHNIPVEPVSGTEAIRQVIQGFAGNASAIEWVMREIAESASGTVLTERLDRFEIAGKWIELPVMGSFELLDGKIVHWRDYFEMKQFTDQMPTG